MIKRLFIAGLLALFSGIVSSAAVASDATKKGLQAQDLFLHQLLTEVRNNLQGAINHALEATSGVAPAKLTDMITAIVAFNQTLGSMERVMQLFVIGSASEPLAVHGKFISLCNAFPEFYPWNIDDLNEKLRAFEAFVQRQQPRNSTAATQSASITNEVFAMLRTFSYHLRQCLMRPECFGFTLIDRGVNACMVQPFRWVMQHKMLASGALIAVLLGWWLRSRPQEKPPVGILRNSDAPHVPGDTRHVRFDSQLNQVHVI